MMPCMARTARLSLARQVSGPLVALATLTFAGTLSAAPAWVDRSLTLPRLVFAGDAGFGIAHQRVVRQDVTGAGLNLEAALGITDAFEIGFRTGVRFGPDGKAVRADSFGRTLFTETYGTNNSAVAAPCRRATICSWASASATRSRRRWT